MGEKEEQNVGARRVEDERDIAMLCGEFLAIPSREPRGRRRMRKIDVFVKGRGRSDVRKALQNTSVCYHFARDQDRKNPTAMSLRSQLHNSRRESK